MSDRKYRPVYMFIFTGLILMVIMMNYSFNLIYYIQNRIYENAVKTLFPVETYFEDNYDENAGSVWADSEEMFGMAQEDKKPATQSDEGVVEAGAPVLSQPAKEVPGNVYNITDLTNYDFLMRFYTVTSITNLTPQIMRPEEFLAKDLSLEKNADAPQILIFHTHSQEGFTDTVEGDTSTTIVGVGDYLTDILTNTYGYNVYHDTSVYDYVDGKLDRSKAYTYAEENVAKILEANPSIEVVIDLHRDGVPDTTRLVTEENGITMSKVMLFNGISYSKAKGDIDYLYNANRDDNLAMSLQMYLLGEEYHPGLLRKIYINAYRYCLHMKGRSMLIEAGAQTNTSTEVKNAMIPVADMLDRLLSGEKAYTE